MFVLGLFPPDVAEEMKHDTWFLPASKLRCSMGVDAVCSMQCPPQLDSTAREVCFRICTSCSFPHPRLSWLGAGPGGMSAPAKPGPMVHMVSAGTASSMGPQLAGEGAVCSVYSRYQNNLPHAKACVAQVLPGDQ